MTHDHARIAIVDRLVAGQAAGHYTLPADVLAAPNTRRF